MQLRQGRFHLFLKSLAQIFSRISFHKAEVHSNKVFIFLLKKLSTKLM